MKKLGAEVIDPIQIESHGKVDESEFKVLLYEFKAGLNEYLASTQPAATLQDTRGHHRVQRDKSRSRNAVLRPGHFPAGPGKGPLTAKEYLNALKICRRLSTVEGIDAVMIKHTPGCAGSAHYRSGISHRLGARRSLHRRRERRRCRPSRATRISPFPRAACSACRSAYPSSAAPGANRG